ncbi:protein kinase [Clostridium sp. CM028]|uniref:protein kinase n=1 Tax=unclassified Clostridium TaxID=2614128 RepID=UPI001C6E7DD6|nr:MULTISPECIES: protein kinase [unclassified Clostridium]MBW9145621.1 protein kinase [Clostridium sp. CM027]MBW9149471.1 protein kinase [Clostridium sp. CM028]UVE41525.1 protein kinase [Clostridium sp. CM027]WLC62175.1 protein kinase [Clostridium sp. CM028]
MNEDKNYYIQLNSRVEKMIRKSEFLGSGHNGIVYLLPGKKVIKIFKDKKVCEGEYNILIKTRRSKYFPRVYEHGAYYIVRDYACGERLDKYIKKHGINKKISLNIIKLIAEFKKLKFKRLDIRCKDLYLTDDFSINVIDPKNNYSKNVIYPRHLMKGLNNLGVVDEFLSTVSDENPEIYKLWNLKFKQYLEETIK